MQLNDDVVRQALRRCSPGAVLRFAATSRGNRALAREEALWEALFVRAGARLRPPGVWAAAAAAGADDELLLEHGSWRAAFRAYHLGPLGADLLVRCPSRKRLRVASGALGLQQALALAQGGDIIELAPGAYPQHITLSRAVTLVGDSRDCVQVGSVRAEADGVTLARLTIVGALPEMTRAQAEAAGGVAAPPEPAVCVSAGTALIFDCNLRGMRGVEVEAGSCRVLSCDVQTQHACFRGAGDLDRCRLETRASAAAGALAHASADAQTAVVFGKGRSRLTNCLVEGGNVGVHVESGASSKIRDCDIQATDYGVSVHGSNSLYDHAAHLLLEDSRYAHACSLLRAFLPHCSAPQANASDVRARRRKPSGPALTCRVSRASDTAHASPRWGAGCIRVSLPACGWRVPGHVCTWSTLSSRRMLSGCWLRDGVIRNCAHAISQIGVAAHIIPSQAEPAAGRVPPCMGVPVGVLVGARVPVERKKGR